MLNPSRLEEMLSGKGTSNLSKAERIIASTIVAAVAADASNAFCLSSIFSASIIIIKDETTA